MPASMLAVVHHNHGGSEVLQVAEVTKPAPRPTEVLVKVYAAGVNPVDWKTRAGDQGTRVRRTRTRPRENVLRVIG
jgi:NADPH:quinone reductase-like Zn-dependent oxidoreductase